jgi:hypothetical protein
MILYEDADLTLDIVILGRETEEPAVGSRLGHVQIGRDSGVALRDRRAHPVGDPLTGSQ